MNLEGKLLGNRYEMVEKVGNGGMSTVYKAVDKVLKRNVAVKILRDEFTTDEEFIKRFEAEAQSAARLTHANIVSIYDVGVEGNLHYIVMELIQGKTLKEIIIKERGPLPWKWSVNVAIQIASALDMAHKNNIVHRDIKPHNIIITEDGIAKVTDFGIAKAVSNSTITAFGTTIGSVHYFSPEHARGGFTDAKSDLYSLGVVMYEMLTGRVPFDADTPVSVALKHMQEEPEEPIEINPHIPVAINKIIMKALQKDATLRYQSASEMLSDLKKSLKNPDGDFVEELEYDNTARTQKIDMDEYGEIEERYSKNKKGKKEGKFKKFIKNHKVLSVFVGLILLFSLSLGGTLAVLNMTNPAEVEMPNVVGMSKEEAQKEVEAAKLVFEVEKEEYHKEVPEGFVISQDPTYMERFNKVKEGSIVKVVISKGQEKATVPNVKGKEKDEAIKLIEEAKLKAEIIEETSKTVKEGFVISQETDPDTEVFAGDMVKLHVSNGTGIKEVSVVSVIGQDEATAKRILQDLGLKVNVTYVNSTSDNGKVAKQSIEENKKVDEGTTITLTVNKVAETKNLIVNVDVKAITGGYVESEESTESKTVTVKVNSETRTVNKNDTCIVELSGKEGTELEVKVVISDQKGDIYKSSKTITLGTLDTISFTKQQ